MLYMDFINKVYYPFIIGGVDTPILVKDITHNVRFIHNFINSIPEQYTYKLKDGERLDVVSENVYGNPRYDWILMLANGIYDIHKDLPLTGDDLNILLTNKYGSRRNDAHHYIDSSGHISDAKIAIKTDSPTTIKVGSIIRKKTSAGYYHGVVEKVIGDTLIVLFSAGDFRVGDTINISYYEKVNNKTVESIAKNIKIVSSDLFIEYSQVTNAEYEYQENENRRTIKIVPFEYIPQIINEFKQTLNG